VRTVVPRQHSATHRSPTGAAPRHAVTVTGYQIDVY
jgi:hypothetical protein